MRIQAVSLAAVAALLVGVGLAACGGGSSAPPAPAAASLLSGTAVSATQANLAWTDNATNETGFDIQRSPAGANTFASVGTVAANVTAFSDMSAPGGSVDYRVVAFNGGTFGAPSNVVRVDLPVGPQNGQLSIDLTTLVVTVTQQPANLTLAPAGPATWPGVGNPLTVDLGVQNGYHRLIFNLKALVTGIGQVGASATGDGTYQGDPYFYYGANAIDVAAMRNDDIVIDGVTGAVDPLVIDLTFVNHAMLFGSSDYYDGNLYADDAGGTGQSQFIDINQFGGSGQGNPGSSSGYSNPMVGVCSPDGRYLYYGCRNQPMIITVDTTTLTPVAGTDLTGANDIRYDGSGLGSYGMTRAVSMSPDGQHLYVVLMTMVHAYECSTSSASGTGMETVEVVKLLRSTMTEVGRVVLLSGVDECQGHRLSLSADGTQGALSIMVYSSSYGVPAATVQGRFFTLDTTTMTATVHDVSAVGAKVDQATISADGTKVYYIVSDNTANMGSNDNLLRMYDIATDTHATVGTPTSFTLDDIKSLRWGPDGRLYILAYSDFAIYDPVTDAILEPGLPVVSTEYGVDFAGDGKSYYVWYSNSTAHWVDIATDTLLSNPADGGATVPTPDQDQGHAHLVTPY